MILLMNTQHLSFSFLAPSLMKSQVSKYLRVTEQTSIGVSESYLGELRSWQLSEWNWTLGGREQATQVSQRGSRKTNCRLKQTHKSWEWCERVGLLTTNCIRSKSPGKDCYMRRDHYRPEWWERSSIWSDGWCLCLHNKELWAVQNVQNDDNCNDKTWIVTHVNMTSWQYVTGKF